MTSARRNIAVMIGMWVVCLAILAVSIQEYGNVRFRAGIKKGQRDMIAGGLRVMDPEGSEKVGINRENDREFRLVRFIDVTPGFEDRVVVATQYVCGEIKRWESAATGFEEARNAFEPINSDAVRDLDGKLLGAIDYRRR